ncbi:hypothetical protein [Actinomycetospora sp. TBRC 11914]|uniref:glycan biosynthesis hexose transferase WsfD n=1 Tax=Actinomycetospora sp. TBRC 11914 TaxID=2729387 RepID=UPI00145CD4D1|nr:hypothetical protein [Actinomycetospora sp. TBRC 11914]NMO93573.1 hypothetical protein [Actinomycetospora sp. TBRC 11914]
MTTPRRLLLAVAVAVLVAAGLVWRLGLGTDGALGAADNADGARLFCTAWLAPDATDGHASGHGIVVTRFRTGGPACRIPAPVTSAGVVLGAVVAATTGPAEPAPFDLEALAAAYAGLFGLGAGIAAWAAGARARPGLVVLAVVAPPVLPLLVVPWWSRFLVSTYDEPAGLLGAAWIAGGLLAVAVTRPADRAARTAALALLAAGAVVAATAKPAFVPLGLTAAAACLLVAVGATRWRRRVPGLVAGVVAVALAASPVLAGIRYQDTLYEVPNTHDLVFTAILPESGPAALPALGLPPEAWQRSGEHYYLDLGRNVPGWTEVPGPRTTAIRAAARAYVAAHPLLLARMVHRGLIATLRPQVPYLVPTTAGARTVSGSLPVPDVPEGAQHMGVTFAYFDRLPGRWVPPTIVAAALLAAAAATVLPRRGRGRTARGLARVSGVLAVAAVGTVVLAVLGDGYVELAKHVWLASYLLVVTATVLLLAAGTALARRRPHSPLSDTAAASAPEGSSTSRPGPRPGTSVGQPGPVPFT